MGPNEIMPEVPANTPLASATLLPSATAVDPLLKLEGVNTSSHLLQYNKQQQQEEAEGRKMTAFKTTLLLNLALIIVLSSKTTQAFQPVAPSTSRVSKKTSSPLYVIAPEEEKTAKASSGSNVEETTEKYGLEAGLFESLKQKDGGESAKSLLKKYGIAYLATSIPLAIVSFAICYVLVDNGVDMGELLGKVGIDASATSEKAGTVAIAYAAHKAASPIRFPPTVALTPVVAKLIGKEPEEEEEAAEP